MLGWGLRKSNYEGSTEYLNQVSIKSYFEVIVREKIVQKMRNDSSEMRIRSNKKHPIKFYIQIAFSIIIVLFLTI
jgi:hypothetical protein